MQPSVVQGIPAIEIKSDEDLIKELEFLMGKKDEIINHLLELVTELDKEAQEAAKNAT